MNEPKRNLLIATLALTLAFGLMSSNAMAQDTTGSTTTGGATTGTTETARTTDDDDNDTDYGWLGLLGLAGLAGLRKKPDHIVHERTTTPPSGTNTGVR